MTFNWTQVGEKFVVEFFYGQIWIPHEILYQKVNNPI